jgi:hypothetical protein
MIFILNLKQTGLVQSFQIIIAMTIVSLNLLWMELRFQF